jgi:hypothetical protein
LSEINITVETITALKALASSSFTDGDVVLVQGYHSAGDGKGGQFYLVSSTEPADDGVVISTYDNVGKRWKRISVGPVRVGQFGAYGDGVNDDTLRLNSAVAFWLSQQHVGSLIFDKGTYKISAPIAIVPGRTLTTPWGIIAEGATIIADSSSFVGENALRISNTPNCQLTNFSIQGSFAIVGCPKVAECVVLLDGSGTASSTSYTAFYKSSLRDLAVSGFGFPLAETLSGTSRVHGVIVRGNFHESIIDGWRLVGVDALDGRQGDGFRFENGSYFSGGAVALLRIKNTIVSSAYRGFYQIGSYFDALYLESVGTFSTDCEAIRMDSSSRGVVTNSHFEDAWKSNTNDSDFSKGAIVLSYGGTIDSIFVRGNGSVGQAKSALVYYGAGMVSCNNIRISGTCSRVIHSTQHISGGAVDIPYSSSFYGTNKAIANHYGRVLEVAGIQDILRSVVISVGYDFSGPYAYQFYPNLAYGCHFITDVSSLSTPHSTTNYVDIRDPICAYDRGYQATSGGTIIPFLEGNVLALTLRQNHVSKVVIYRFNPIFISSGALSLMSLGDTITIRFQYLFGKWIEVGRSPLYQT